MDKLMDSPWFLRVMALLLAFLLFFTVKAANDTPDAADSGTVTEELEDVPLEVFYDNASLMVSGLPETVDLTITGPTSIVQTTRQLKDFTLFVDLRDLTIGEHRVPIQTENLSEQLRVQMDPAFADITIEERVTEEFRIDPELNERLLMDGFVLEGITAEPNSVTVTGPKSVIDSISFVKATVTGEPGIKESFQTEARVRVLANDLTKLENVTIEPEVADVSVTVKEYSREVPVAIKPIGDARAGITIDSLTLLTDKVQIRGPKNIVDAISELAVEVDISDITAEDTTLEVELEVPQGATSITPEKLTVEAGITVEDTAQLPDGEENADTSNGES